MRLGKGCSDSIEDEDNNNLTKEPLAICAHWSPLELEIVDDEDNNLIKVFLTIGAHWSPLESLGVPWSWRLKMRMIII